MTTTPKIDVRDLKSVRRAAEQHESVVLGDDWIAPRPDDTDLQKRRARRGFLQLNKSPLARKIITFNLMGLIVLVAGVLYLSPSRDNLAFQRGSSLVNEAELIADVFEAQLPLGAPVNLVTGDGIEAQTTLEGLDLRGGVDVYLFDRQGVLVSSWSDPTNGDMPVPGLELEGHGTLITDFLNGVFNWFSSVLRDGDPAAMPVDPVLDFGRSVQQTIATGTQFETRQDSEGRAFFTVSTPVMQGDQPVGVIAVVSAPGELNALVSRDREQLLQMFVIGAIVSIALSLVLASTIANPLSDLAEAAELGRDKNARKVAPERIRIPDLTGRPDEIGRLQRAQHGVAHKRPAEAASLKAPVDGEAAEHHHRHGLGHVAPRAARRFGHGHQIGFIAQQVVQPSGQIKPFLQRRDQYLFPFLGNNTTPVRNTDHQRLGPGRLGLVLPGLGSGQLGHGKAQKRLVSVR